MGSGPFRVAAASAAEIVLEAFPEYHGGPPRRPRLVLREIPDAIVRALELEKGSVHLAVNALPPDLVPRFRHRARFRVVESPGANYVYLGLNLRDPRLADVRVRRALLLALDRERLVATLWRGLGVVTRRSPRGTGRATRASSRAPATSPPPAVSSTRPATPTPTATAPARASI